MLALIKMECGGRSDGKLGNLEFQGPLEILWEILSLKLGRHSFERHLTLKST